jgi:hypothetical protein
VPRPFAGRYSRFMPGVGANRSVPSKITRVGEGLPQSPPWRGAGLLRMDRETILREFVQLEDQFEMPWESIPVSEAGRTTTREVSSKI